MPFVKPVTPKDYGRIELGEGMRPDIPDGFASWIQNGKWYAAPKVDPNKFGPHMYMEPGAFEHGCRDCICGSWTTAYNSGGR